MDQLVRTQEENDFFKFYKQLQLSAAYYSNLAMRQMSLSYPSTRANNIKPPPSSSSQISPENLSKFPRRRTGASKVSQLNGGCAVPVIQVCGVSCGGGGGDTLALEKSMMGKQRKVYFAHPLSTIKIKSPTPMYFSLEDADDPGNEFRISEEDKTEKEIEDEFLESTDDEVENVWAGGSALITANRMYDSLHFPEGQKQRKKKRRKKKRTTTETEPNQFNDIPPIDSSEEDPYGIYEVLLNEEDYEFISEVRLCGEVKEHDMCAAELLSQHGLEEMDTLYGHMGAVRILKMETTIEENFKKMCMKVAG